MATLISAIPDERNRGMLSREESSFPEPVGISHQARLNDLAITRTKPDIPLHVAGRKDAQQRIEDNEEMRRYIARELHDDIGQRLSLLSIRLGLLQRLYGMDDPDHNLAESIRDLHILISDVHFLSHSLHSSRIERVGLEAALREIFERLTESHGTRISFFVESIPDRLPPGRAVCFFRIAQESLNNAIKHGGASQIQINLSSRNGILTMRIQDFGVGFDKSLIQNGIGFMTMEERMAAVGGTLTVDSEPGVGTIVIAATTLFPFSNVRAE